MTFLIKYKFQTASPLGSHENLHSPQSPESQRNDWSRKNSLMADTGTHRRISNDDGQDQKQSTSDMFKDMLSQKRNMIMSKLTSFDSEVSFHFAFHHYIRVVLVC